MTHIDEWEDDYFYDENDERVIRVEDLCVGCGREGCGDACGECGGALCPMHHKLGCGFCKGHPSEDFNPFGNEISLPSTLDGSTEQQCPLCGRMVAEYAECRTAKLFTARDPLEGLMAWGAAGMPKTVLCESSRHLHFADPGGTRLVLTLDGECEVILPTAPLVLEREGRVD